MFLVGKKYNRKDSTLIFECVWANEFYALLRAGENLVPFVVYNKSSSYYSEYKEPAPRYSKVLHVLQTANGPSFEIKQNPLYRGSIKITVSDDKTLEVEIIEDASVKHLSNASDHLICRWSDCFDVPSYPLNCNSILMFIS